MAEALLKVTFPGGVIHHLPDIDAAFKALPEGWTSAYPSNDTEHAKSGLHTTIFYGPKRASTPRALITCDGNGCPIGPVA